MKKNKNVSNRGAPKKKDDEKIGADGLSAELNQWVKETAEERGVSIAYIKREAISWYKDAIEKSERLSLQEAISREV